MNPEFFYPEPAKTAFILLDTKKCTACWKCLQICTNDVIGRINLPWHKHVKLVNKKYCTGCLRCVKVCNSGALKKISHRK